MENNTEKEGKVENFSFPVKDELFVTSKHCRPWKHCVLIAKVKEGVALRDSKDSTKNTLFYTHAEWDAFTKSIKDGEF